MLIYYKHTHTPYSLRPFDLCFPLSLTPTRLSINYIISSGFPASITSPLSSRFISLLFPLSPPLSFLMSSCLSLPLSLLSLVSSHSRCYFRIFLYLPHCYHSLLSLSPYIRLSLTTSVSLYVHRSLSTSVSSSKSVSNRFTSDLSPSVIRLLSLPPLSPPPPIPSPSSPPVLLRLAN